MMNKKLIVALGIGLFGVQLGSQVSQADTVAPFLVSTREAEVPDLPTDPELPDETPDVPTLPTTDDSTSDSGGGAETPDVPVEPELPNPDVPSEPETPPTDSDIGGDTGTTTPPDTGDSSTGGDTGITPPPDTGDSSTGGGTGTTTPPDTGNSGTGGDTGITTPPDTGNSGTGGNAGTITLPTNGNSSGQTMTPPTTNIGVNSDGTVNQSGNVGQTMPVQTNNVNELTHIPTASTPIEADTGEKIVSVVDGVPYKQTEQGLIPVTANITKLSSGNIAVKGSDGQLKVLPKTGEKETVLGTVLGVGMVALSGIGVWFKKRKQMNEENR